MDPLERQSLSAEWHADEAELQRPRDLSTGYADPAARERELDGRQEEIEGAMAVERVRERRRLLM